MSEFSSIVLVLVLLLIALCIAWILLPLAIIGTKPLLREILAQQKRTNQLLEAAHTIHNRVEANTRVMATARQPKPALPPPVGTKT